MMAIPRRRSRQVRSDSRKVKRASPRESRLHLRHQLRTEGAPIPRELWFTRPWEDEM